MRHMVQAFFCCLCFNQTPSFALMPYHQHVEPCKQRSSTRKHHVNVAHVNVLGMKLADSSTIDVLQASCSTRIDAHQMQGNQWQRPENTLQQSLRHALAPMVQQLADAEGLRTQVLFPKRQTLNSLMYA
jgi:hypothetical protein